MKLSPGVVPQWPSRRGLTCSRLQRLAQQRVVEQVDLPDRQVVGGAPVGVDQLEGFGHRPASLPGRSAGFVNPVANRHDCFADGRLACIRRRCDNRPVGAVVRLRWSPRRDLGSIPHMATTITPPAAQPVPSRGAVPAGGAALARGRPSLAGAPAPCASSLAAWSCWRPASRSARWSRTTRSTTSRSRSTSTRASGSHRASLRPRAGATRKRCCWSATTSAEHTTTAPVLPHSNEMLLVRLDPNKPWISMMSIPRELWVTIDCPRPYTTATTPLNYALQCGGIGTLVSTIKQVTGLSVNHVVEIDFNDFKRAVDGMGCVFTTIDRRYYGVTLHTVSSTRRSTSSRLSEAAAASARCGSSSPPWRHIAGAGRPRPGLPAGRQAAVRTDLIDNIGKFERSSANSCRPIRAARGYRHRGPAGSAHLIRQQAGAPGPSSR